MKTFVVFRDLKKKEGEQKLTAYNAYRALAAIKLVFLLHIYLFVNKFKFFSSQKIINFLGIAKLYKKVLLPDHWTDPAMFETGFCLN